MESNNDKTILDTNFGPSRQNEIIIRRRDPKNEKNGEISTGNFLPKIKWKVDTGGLVKSGETIAIYYHTSTPSKSEVNGISLSTNDKKLVSSGFIRARKRIRPRTGAIVGDNPETCNSREIANSDKSGKDIKSTEVKNGGISKYVLSVKGAVNVPKLLVSEVKVEPSSSPKSQLDSDTPFEMNGHISPKLSAVCGKIPKKKVDTVSSSVISKTNGLIPNCIDIQAVEDGFLEIYGKPVRRIPSPSNISTTNPYNDSNLTHWAIGVIQACDHPAVIDSLCAVCGMPVTNSTTSFESDQPLTDAHRSNLQIHNPLTVSGGTTICVSNVYAANIAKESSSVLFKSRKLHLVLDLDHTLLHATTDPRAALWKARREDVRKMVLPPSCLQSQSSVLYVKLRPFLAEFLLALMDKFEITIYTAGTRSYANQIAKIISRHLVNYEIDKRLEHSQTKDEATNLLKIMPMGKCIDEVELDELRKSVAMMGNTEKQKDILFKPVENNDAANHNDSINNNKIKKCVKQVREIEASSLDSDNSDLSLNEKSKVIVETNKITLDSKNDNKSESHINVNTSSLKRSNSNNEEKADNASKDNNKKCKRVRFEYLSHSSKENVEINEILMTNAKIRGESKDNEQNVIINDQNMRWKQLQEKLRNAEQMEERATMLRMKLFGSRIVSRTDVGDLGQNVKSLKRVFPCGGRYAAIVDDREDVWANAHDNQTGEKGEPPGNLVLVRPYKWPPFLEYADVNNAAGADITQEEKTDKKTKSNDNLLIEEDSQLLWTKEILLKLHNLFYGSFSALCKSKKEETVPSLLKKMKKNVLRTGKKQAKIILSGLVPLHMQDQIGKQLFPRPPAVRYAEELGAEIISDITPQLTHVVAARDGTDKIMQSRVIPGCAVVNAKWLWDCYWSISRRDESMYSIGSAQNIQKGSIENILISDSDSSESNDSSEDEDTLAAELKEMMES